MQIGVCQTDAAGVRLIVVMDYLQQLHNIIIIITTTIIIYNIYYNKLDKKTCVVLF